ncbi:CPXCG motif-containing cysteine-rich protein [Myxococcaceae bacterium JPH2]|nr:CPXCG motif-containing cysteine-rich protein [Myxococcaceae bacterium JPH2]
MQPFAEGDLQMCPYCGEDVEVEVDVLGASAESYVEDCPVCCRPWVVQVTRGEDGAAVTLRREDD